MKLFGCLMVGRERESELASLALSPLTAKGFDVMKLDFFSMRGGREVGQIGERERGC